MLRVGIIGCGGIIERRHLPGLLERSTWCRCTTLIKWAHQDVCEGGRIQ